MESEPERSLPQFTEAQLRIIESLEPAGEIARVFEAGARIRNEPSFPARGYFLGHAMREILNKLPDYYEGGVDTQDDLTAQVSYSAEQTEALWVNWSEAVDVHLQPSAEITAPVSTDIVITRALALEINAFLRSRVAGGKAKQRLIAFLAKFQKTDPAFMVDIAEGLLRLEAHGLAHVPKPEKVRDEAEVIEKWDHFEGILLGLCGERHRRYAEIATELDEWNSL